MITLNDSSLKELAMSTRLPARLTFSLSALVLVLAGVAGGLAYWNQPEYIELAAYFELRHNPIVATPGDEASFRRFRLAQPALARSPLVTGPVLADEDIARLPILRSAENRLKVITDRLEVSFPDEETMLFTMRGTGEEIQQVRKILNAVAHTYLKIQKEHEDKVVNRRMQILSHQFARYEEEFRRLTELQWRLQKQNVDGLELDLVKGEVERVNWALDQIARQKLILDINQGFSNSVNLQMQAEFHTPN